MQLLGNPEFGELGNDLIALINDASAIDSEKNFINFDKLLTSPKFRGDLASIVEKSLLLVTSNFDPNKTVLVSPNNLRKPFGLIPTVSCVSSKLGTYSAVWKEAGDVSTGKGIFLGPVDLPLDCFFFQDVIARGTTILKIAPAIKKTAWQMKAYICMVNASLTGNKFEKYILELSTDLNMPTDLISLHYIAELVDDNINNFE